MINCPTDNQIVLLYAAVTPEVSARILKERIKMLWHKHLLHAPFRKRSLLDFQRYFQLQLIRSVASVHGYFLTWKLKLGNKLFTPIYVKIFIIIINYYYCCCCWCTFATIYSQQLTKIQSEEKLKQPKKKKTKKRKKKKRNNKTTTTKKQEQKRAKNLRMLRFTNFALIRSVS